MLYFNKMLNSTTHYNINFLNISNIWSFQKKQEYKHYLSNRNIFSKNWSLHKYSFCDEFKNSLQKMIIVNYEKYNYNLIQYMCKFKSDIKMSILDFCVIVGLFIPHYCYHPDLSIAGNCRMCLIQLDGSAKPIVACAILLVII